ASARFFRIQSVRTSSAIETQITTAQRRMTETTIVPRVSSLLVAVWRMYFMVLLLCVCPATTLYSDTLAGASKSTAANGSQVSTPDFALRMIMLDMARQNENFDYYRRVIDFCARYKINAILLHLTDDQTAALYEPRYPEL